MVRIYDTHRKLNGNGDVIHLLSLGFGKNRYPYTGRRFGSSSPFILSSYTRPLRFYCRFPQNGDDAHDLFAYIGG